MFRKSLYPQKCEYCTLSSWRSIILIFCIFAIFGFTSCINLREDYPKIEYYELKPTQDAPSRIKADGILQVRPFDASSILSERRFIVEKSSGGYDKFYYHRWADDFQELFTWLTINRLSNLKCMTGGIVSQGTALIPNYILEGSILQLRIYNNENKEDSSFVSLSVKISLMAYPKDSTSLKVIYANVYDKKIMRESSKASTIAPAVNDAANEIITRFSEDIIKEINK